MKDDKIRLQGAEAYAWDKGARITRMNALSRAVEYAKIVHSQKGRLLAIE